jgi:hypothetical protein
MKMKPSRQDQELLLNLAGKIAGDLIRANPVFCNFGKDRSVVIAVTSVDIAKSIINEVASFDVSDSEMEHADKRPAILRLA